MKSPFPTVGVVVAGAVRVAARFPFVVLAAAAGSAWAIMAVEAEGAPQQRVMLTCALALPLMLGLRLVRERLRSHAPRGLLIEVAGVLLLFGYALSIPQDFEGTPGVVWERFMVLNIGLHLAVAYVPCLTGASEREYWQFNRRLFQRFVLSALYSGVLNIGLSLAIASADKLFNLDVSAKRYSELWILMAGVFNTLFFLGGVPSPADGLERDESSPRGIRAFAQFALAPLVIVFVPILYLYALKIIVHWSWPHGWVALPVCSLAVVGILAALLLQPARNIEAERWARWYWRNFFRALAPLSVLLLLSMRERVAAYGVTEWRYFGLVIGAWLLVVSAYYCARPGGSTRIVPGSLALICLATAAGPWSAFSVSAASQTRRLLALLEPYGAVQDGGLVPASRPIAAAEIASARSILSHLISLYGVEGFPRLLAAYSADASGSKHPARGNEGTYARAQSVVTFVIGKFDANAVERMKPNAPSYVSADLDLGHGLQVGGYRRLDRASIVAGSGVHGVGDLAVEFPRGNSPPRISAGGKQLDVAAVEALLASVAVASEKGVHKLAPPLMSARLASGGREWLLVIENLHARFRKGARPDLLKVDILVLEK